MPLSRYDGIFEPDDLRLLQRVFDQLCDERHLTREDNEAREALAEEIIGAFRRGVTDEAELRRAISQSGNA